jgi:hypothetical protein
MKPALAYTLGVIGCVACLAIAVYYWTPMDTAHFLSSHGPHYRDTLHAIAFAVAGIACLVAARFAANAGRAPTR